MKEPNWLELAVSILAPLHTEYRMERDDQVASLYDGADEMDLARWEAQALEEERESQLEQALDEAMQRGVSVESLRTLAREAGATHWALVNSLKG